MKIAIIANTCWYVYNFRRNLAKCLSEAGHHIVFIAGQDRYAERLRSEGFTVRTIPLSARGTRPHQELRTVLSIRRAIRQSEAKVILSFTPKGNIYSTIATIGIDIAQVANVSGLGQAFSQETWLTKLSRALYHVVFSRSAWVFFQNREDQQLFIEAGMVRANLCERVPGSGIDLSAYRQLPLPCESEDPGQQKVVFLLVARLLWEKGVHEFVEAARRVQEAFPGIECRLLGFIEEHSVAAVSRLQIDSWVTEGVVEYLGTTDDVRDALEGADCVVLPSYYREGVPRSLLEAAAMGRPVITTRTAGCRDVVDDGSTGFLCEPRSVDDLARCMIEFVRMTPAQRAEFGRRGRQKMESEFDEQIVISRYVRRISELERQ